MEDEFLELRDSKSGRNLLFDNLEVIKALKFMRETNSKATNDMLESFIEMFPYETDDNIAFLISKFVLDQIRLAEAAREEAIEKMQSDLQRMMLLMLNGERRPKNRRCRIPKPKLPHVDYFPLVTQLSKKMRLDWMVAVLEKKISPEALCDLRNKLRSIKTSCTSNKEAEKIYRKMQSFIANLRAAVKRFKSAKLKKLATVQSTGHEFRRNTNAREAPTLDRRTLLLQQISNICVLSDRFLLDELSNNKLEKLLMVLQTLNGNPEAHSKLLVMSGLNLALSNDSPFMQATKHGDLKEMLRLIDNEPLQISKENQAADTKWKEYQFPIGTTLRLIIGNNASKKVHLTTALQNIATNVILVGADNLREVQAATESSDIIILATGFVSHKTSILTKGRDSVVLIGQANPATIVREVINYCLSRGISLIKKP